MTLDMLACRLNVPHEPLPPHVPERSPGSRGFGKPFIALTVAFAARPYLLAIAFVRAGVSGATRTILIL